MKKFTKILSAALLSLVLCLSLAGCGLYYDYDEALPYNNVYEKIGLKDLTSLLTEQKNNSTENEIVYVVYATSDVLASENCVVTIDEQAKQFGIEKVYYLDCEKYYNDSDKKAEVKEQLGMRDPSICPAVLMFVDGELEVDWSKTNTKNSYDGSYTKLAYDIFYTKVNELN